jgi:hypothetical protein
MRAVRVWFGVALAACGGGGSALVGELPAAPDAGDATADAGRSQDATVAISDANADVATATDAEAEVDADTAVDAEATVDVVADSPGTAFAIQSDGVAIYVGGFATFDNQKRWTVEKRAASDGGLVPAFGDGGVVDRIQSFSASVSALALAPTSLYVGGGAEITPGDEQWVVLKLSTATGASDGAFGFSAPNFSSGRDRVEALALDGGFLYVGGSAFFGPETWRIFKCDAATGALIGSFGQSGMVTTDLGGKGFVDMHAMVVTGGAIYSAGRATPPLQSYTWRIEKRDAATGAFDPSFGTGGEVYGSIGDVRALATDGTALWAAGMVGSGNSVQWRLEKRSLVDGSLIGAFGDGGVTEDPTIGIDQVNALLLAPPNLYALGIDNPDAGVDLRWRLEKRLADTGSLVNTLLRSPSAADGTAHGLAIAGSRLFMVGSAATPFGLDWHIEATNP